jgi:hypothetical protein
MSMQTVLSLSTGNIKCLFLLFAEALNAALLISHWHEDDTSKRKSLILPREITRPP